MYVITSTLMNSNGDYLDDYQLADTIDEANQAVEVLKQRPDIYSWAIAKIIDSSEPHWIKAVDDDAATLADNAWGTDK